MQPNRTGAKASRRSTAERTHYPVETDRAANAARAAGTARTPGAVGTAGADDSCDPRRANAASSTTARALDDLDARWLAGEPDALDAAHRRYRARLEAVANRIVGNHADAEDVVQKIFIALGGITYRGESSLWTYLYRAAVNGAVNVLRAKRRRENAEKRLLEAELVNTTLVNGTLSPGPDNTVLEGEVMAAVARALLHVKPQHRRVLTLRIMHGLSNSEIAEREGLPVPTVGTWLRRGREELRRGLRPLMKELGAGRQ